MSVSIESVQQVLKRNYSPSCRFDERSKEKSLLSPMQDFSLAAGTPLAGRNDT